MPQTILEIVKVPTAPTLEEILDLVDGFQTEDGFTEKRHGPEHGKTYLLKALVMNLQTDKKYFITAGTLNFLAGQCDCCRYKDRDDKVLYFMVEEYDSSSGALLRSQEWRCDE